MRSGVCRCDHHDYPAKIGKYLMKKTIGEGAFSIVKLCVDAENEKYYACKIIPKCRLISCRFMMRFEIEIRINQQLHHPGIVEMVDFLSDNDNFYFFMEYCPNGDLLQYVVGKKKLREKEAKLLFKQILETLKYIHSIGVSHRDLKLENILIDNFGKIKISDFGLSRFVDGDMMVRTPCGSPSYASPECISGKPYNGITTDLWSCGVILFAMVTGQLPWTKRNQNELFQQIRNGEYSIPFYLSRECKNMIQKLLTVNTLHRYNIDQALNDSWLIGTPKQLENNEFFSYVSLKKIDFYFRKEISYMESNKRIDILGKTESLMNYDFNKIKAIFNNNKRKKCHQENKNYWNLTKYSQNIIKKREKNVDISDKAIIMYQNSRKRKTLHKLNRSLSASMLIHHIFCF